MKKTLLILLLLVVFINCNCQTFKKYELKRLNSFEIKTENNEIYNSENYLNLKNILEKEQKQRTRKTGAIVFASLSVLTTAFGAKIFSSSKNDQEGLGQSIGTMFIVVGTIELGIAIPILISSNRRKKERNKLIEYYKIQNP